jgi:hypothetical protein
MTKVAGSYRAGHDTRRATLIMVDYRAPTGEPSAQLLFDAMNTQLKKKQGSRGRSGHGSRRTTRLYVLVVLDFCREPRT